MTVKKCLLVALLAVTGIFAPHSTPLFAQIQSGRIVGTVFDPNRAVPFRHGAQELGVKSRIQLIGVIQAVVGQMGELALVGRPQL